MNVHDLLTLYDYNRWANNRLLKAVEQLSTEEFTRRVGGTYDSVRTTLVHIIEVERGWLARCEGNKEWVELNPDDYPSPESIREEWDKAEQFIFGIISRLNEADLRRRVPYYFDKDTPRSVPLAEMLQHTANHSAHHRGQVAMMLRMLGYVPGNVDMLFYYDERSGGAVE